MFKPLLYPGNYPMRDEEFFSRLKYPYLCSPKLDGIRAIIKDNVAYSRKFIALPSYQYQLMFGMPAATQEFDGEFIEGNPSDFDVYNRTQSYVMSENKVTDNPRFYVFDIADEMLKDVSFVERLDIVRELCSDVACVHFVPHVAVANEVELLDYEAAQLQLGYEGIMLRSFDSRYKHGRATVNENIGYKLKRFADDEAVIVDFVEQMHNTNEDTRDELGNAKRSTAKSGLVPAATLGKFICAYGEHFIEIGCGVLTHAKRKYIWENRDKFMGLMIKFRHFPHGKKDLPRFPRFVGFRDKMDL